MYLISISTAPSCPPINPTTPNLEPSIVLCQYSQLVCSMWVIKMYKVNMLTLHVNTPSVCVVCSICRHASSCISKMEKEEACRNSGGDLLLSGGRSITANMLATTCSLWRGGFMHKIELFIVKSEEKQLFLLYFLSCSASLTVFCDVWCWDNCGCALSVYDGRCWWSVRLYWAQML